jgi:hypothetical protein
MIVSVSDVCAPQALRANGSYEYFQIFRIWGAAHTMIQRESFYENLSDEIFFCCDAVCGIVSPRSATSSGSVS